MNLLILPDALEADFTRAIYGLTEDTVVLSRSRKTLNFVLSNFLEKSKGRVLFYYIENEANLLKIINIIGEYCESVDLYGEIKDIDIRYLVSLYEHEKLGINTMNLHSLDDLERKIIGNQAHSKTEKKGSVAILTIQINSFSMTSEFLSSIELVQYSKKQVFLIDNFSNDYSGLRLMLVFPNLFIINPQSRISFCEAFNIAANVAIAAGFDYLFIVNNDTKNFSTDIFEQLVPEIQNETVIVSPKVFDYEKKPLHWQPREFWGIEFNIATEAYLVRSDIWREVQGFNESFVMYCEDLDLMSRISKLGYKGNVVPSVSLDHLGGATIGKRIFIPTYFFLRNLIWVQKNNRGFNKHSAHIVRVEFYLLLLRKAKFSSKKEFLELVLVFMYSILAIFSGLLRSPKSNRSIHQNKLIGSARNRLAFKLR